MQTTSSELLELEGRVTCEACGVLFDGYANYRIGRSNDLSVDDRFTKGLVSEPSRRAAQALNSRFANHRAPQRNMAGFGATTNLYETSYTAPPKKTMPWVVINLFLSCAFLMIFVFGFYKDIHARGGDAAQIIKAHCIIVDCSELYPKKINALQLIGTDIISLPELDRSIFELRATIQNMSNITVQLPDLELELADKDGETISRRVVSAEEYVDSAQRVLGAGMEYDVRLVFRLHGGEPQSFQSYLFYLPEFSRS